MPNHVPKTTIDGMLMIQKRNDFIEEKLTADGPLKLEIPIGNEVLSSRYHIDEDEMATNKNLVPPISAVKRVLSNL